MKHTKSFFVIYIQNNTNKLFQNKFNERITHLLEEINKGND